MTGWLDLPNAEILTTPPKLVHPVVVHVCGPWELAAGYYVQRCLRCDIPLVVCERKGKKKTGYDLGDLVALAERDERGVRYVVRRNRELTDLEQNCAQDTA